MLSSIIGLLTAATALLLMLTEMKWDVQMLQQNSYRNERFTKWLQTSGEASSAGRLLDLVLLVLSVSMFTMSWIVEVIMVAVILIKCVSSWRKKYKKPLVFTKRVLRLLITEAVVVAAIAVAAGIFRHDARTTGSVALAAATFSYALTLAANWAIRPLETAINNRYIDDAKRRLAQMPHMTVVGITGSYGKTSTKHYLNRILSEKYSVLMTPGSYNTPMGVVRTVREMMKPYNDIFIVEMGAKNVGDIREICDIVHPSVGIVTAVGEQHLETFKTIERVQSTKFELVDALPADGFAVLNNDFEQIADRPVTNVPTARYSLKPLPGSDYHITGVTYTPSGTEFTVEGNGSCITARTKLVGECNVSNLAAAVITAKRLGVPDDKIRYAVSRIEQVEHRLNVKRTPGGITIIDDAFNSNPDGSRMALDVLAGMSGGKRIVITPGMIELGTKQEHYNQIFGQRIAKCADVAIIVGQYNRDAILKGIKSGGMDKKRVHPVDSFDQAQKLMLSIARPGDTVLYENDLPDSFK